MPSPSVHLMSSACALAALDMPAGSAIHPVPTFRCPAEFHRIFFADPLYQKSWQVISFLKREYEKNKCSNSKTPRFLQEVTLAFPSSGSTDHPLGQGSQSLGCGLVCSLLGTRPHRRKRWVLGELGECSFICHSPSIALLPERYPPPTPTSPPSPSTEKLSSTKLVPKGVGTTVLGGVGYPIDFWYSLLLLLLLSRFSRVRLCATPETAAHQAPPSLGFSRQEHWSELPFPSPVHESEKWKLLSCV